MRITVVSFLTAIFWSGILVWMIYYMRKKRVSVAHFGISSIVLLYLFCALRVLLPIDFKFTVGIRLRGAFSDIYAYFAKRDAAMVDYFQVTDVRSEEQ